jgi:hypothetical protein
MRFIPTKIHGYMDYLMGALLIISPWLFGFANGGIAQSPTIPMPTHLWLDVGSGALLAISPWLFGFASVVFVPHLIFGLLEIGAGLTTRTVPERTTATRDRI